MTVSGVFMFEHISNYWPDWGVGLALLLIALLILCICLVTIVKLLNSLLHVSWSQWLKQLVTFKYIY